MIVHHSILEITFRYLLLCIGVFIYKIDLYAQEPMPIHYSIDDGLVSNEIYDLFEDEKGFLWIGTNRGVNRFDSHNMQTLTLNDGLADKDILYIRQDRKGRVWFLSYNGKLSYWKNGLIFNERHDSTLKHIQSSSYFSDFLEDSKGNLWFGSYSSGLFKLDTLHAVKHLTRPDLLEKQLEYPSRETFQVIYLFQDLNENVWIISNKGSLKIDRSENYTYRKHRSKHYKGRFAYKAPNYLFTTTTNLVSLMDLKTNEVKWEKEISVANEIYTAKLLSDSLFYVATDNGAYSFDLSGEITDTFLLGKKTSNFLIDRENNLWVSTLENGLYLFKNRSILHYKVGPQYCILSTGDSVISGGLDRQLHSVYQNQMKSLAIDYGPSREATVRDKVKMLFKDSHNQIWLGTYQGLFLLNGLKAKLRMYSGIKEILFDRGKVFLSVPFGFLLKVDSNFISTDLRSYDHQHREKFSILSKNMVKKYHIFDKQLYCLSSFDEDKILFGTDQGVFSYDIDDSIQYLNYLPREKIIDIGQEPSGNLWILEQNNQVYYYQKKEGKLDTITVFVKEDKVILSSLELDGDSSIWISSNKGLVHLQIKEDGYSHSFIDRHHGLKSEDVNDFTITPDFLWLATSDGVSSIPKQSLKDTVPPLLYMDSILIGDSSHTDFSALVLDRGQLSIYYTGISFKDEGALQYEFRLKGKASRSGIVEEQKVILNDLTPSDYEFSLVAIDPSGNRSKVQTIWFKFQLPWWKDLRYWSILIILLSLSIVYLFRSLLKRRILEVKNRIVGAKHITVKSVMNGSKVKIDLDKLVYIEASGHYKELVQEEKKTLVRTSMKDLLEQLQIAPEFMQVHKSYIVNLHKVEAFKADSITLNNTAIPIGRSYRNIVKEQYLLINSNNYPSKEKQV